MGNVVNSSACLIVDERGLLVSDHVTSEIDKNAMAVMCSLLNGTSTRFINTLNLKKLNFVVVNTPKGIFLIKDIFISKLKRKFTLSLFIETKNSKGKNKTIKKQKGFRDYFLKIFGARKTNTYSTYKEILKNVNASISEIQRIFDQ